jgi:hypothetical protein
MAGRWTGPNRFSGPCVRCQQPVLPGSGEVRFDGTRWVLRHSGGRCHTVGYTHYIAGDSPEWQRVRAARLSHAGHRCEWRRWGWKRCTEAVSLECHHRHYRTLGAERLKDVIILCLAHHRIADGRRRYWGAWPLIGRPWRAGPPVVATPSPGRPMISPEAPSARGSGPERDGATLLPKVCAGCGASNLPVARTCPQCGRAFPTPR